MTYNDIAINLLDTSPEAYVACYVSDTSYELALMKANITFIHSYDTEYKLFQDTYDYEWEYVVPLTITPIELPN